jgi:hypothetical protein
MDGMNEKSEWVSIRSQFRSRVRVVCGLALLVSGLILAIPGVPGPGIPTMIVGLIILSDHFAWARRALDWLRTKARNAGLPDWKWLQRSSCGPGVTPKPQGD